MDIFGIPSQAFFGQLLLGLINGSFYAVLSLGLAIIFGLLNIINFAHGAQYMLGAFAALLGLNWLGINYWAALVLAPLAVGLLAVVIERTMLGESYEAPEILQGGVHLGFMFLPIYRAWVVVAALSVCAIAWYVIERTSLGATLRAATQRPDLVQALGINVPVLVTATYATGAALAAFAGVLAAPIQQVNPVMGSNLIIVVFAVVVIGGMGSILGAIVTGLGLGIIEGLTKVFYPEASAVVIFVIMVLVLLVKPAGLFGKQA